MIKPETTQNEPIRYYFDENTQKLYFSIVDVVSIITESTDARNYWKVLKNRLKKAQNKLVTECNQLKMQSSDGKFYKTDAVDKETMLKIIEIISPEYIPLFKQYCTTIRCKTSSSIEHLKDEKKYGEVTYPQSGEISKNITDLRKDNKQLSQKKRIKVKSI